MIALSVFLLGIGFVLSIFFTASEIAIVAVNRTRLRHLLRIGARGARRASRIAEQPESYLSSSLIGLNLSTSLVTIVATFMVRRLDWPHHPALRFTVFLLASLLYLFFAEILPKAVVRLRPTLFLIRLRLPILWSRILFAPAVSLVELVSRKFIRDRLPSGRLSRNELEALLRSAEARSALPQPEGEMANRLFAFHRVRIREVMTPRRLVVCVSESASTEEFLKLARDSGYTRLPTYRQWAGRFTGLVNVFDLLWGEKRPDTIASLVREVPTVGADDLAWEILARFQNTPHRMAFVQDASGRHIGIVTVEDLIEEILGEIRDEFDPPRVAGG